MTTLLVDGDGDAYKAACVNQENIDWGDDGISVDVNKTGAEDYLVSALARYRDVLGADRVIVCLSDTANWRKKLWPDYKANRRDVARPLLLDHCNAFLADNYETERWPRLEADDVMGILSQTIPDAIIVSVDKDMRTVPCRLYNPMHPEDGVATVSLAAAFRWHMMQTLMGDPADGIKGCPGVGPKKAATIVDAILSEPTLDRCSAADAAFDFHEERKAVWNAVVETYTSKRLTKEEALLNARLTHILREPNEYNRKTAKLRLWRPPI